MKVLGTFLKTKRKEKRLTQQQVASQMGWTTPQFVSNIERGVSRLPSNCIKKMVELYGMNADELIEVILQEKREDLKALVA